MKLKVRIFIVLWFCLIFVGYTDIQNITENKSLDLSELSQKSDLFPNSQDFLTNVESFSNSPLYIEQVNVEIFSNRTLIHNALLEANPFFLPSIDWMEPDFQGVSMVVVQTNNSTKNYFSLVEPWSRTIPTIENIPFIGGFLFSLPDLANNFSIIQNNVFSRIEKWFGMDFIALPAIYLNETVWIPFYASFLARVDCQIALFQQGIDLLPDAGIFASLHTIKDEILSPQTIRSKYIAQNLFILNHWDSLHQIQQIINLYSQSSNITSFLNFDYNYIALQNPIYYTLKKMMQSIEDNFDPNQNLNAGEGNILPIEGIDSSDFINLSLFQDYIVKQQNIVVFDFVYEGITTGYKLNAQNLMEFDFFKAGGYKTIDFVEINPKCFKSSLGWLSGISISLFQGEIQNISHDFFKFSNLNVLPIQYEMFLNNRTDWIQSILDFKLKVAFQAEGLKQQLMVWPEKYKNYYKGIPEIFGYTLPFGIPVIPGLLVGEIPNLCLNISQESLQPVLDIRKHFINTTINNVSNPLGYGIIHNELLESLTPQNKSWIDFEIEIKNIGAKDVWGIPLRILDGYGFKNEAPKHQITNALVELGYDPYSMFSNEYPRYFPVDVFGTGDYIGIIPDFLDLDAMIPFSKEFSDTIYMNREQIQTKTGLQISSIMEFCNRYNDSKNIYNPQNWKITPQQTIKVKYSQYLQSELPSNYNGSYEILFPSTVRYAEETGLQYFEAKSNSILLKKDHIIYSNGSITGTLLNLTQAVTVFSETPVINSQTHQTYLLNYTIVNIGENLISNGSLEFPAIGILSELPNSTTYKVKTNESVIQTSIINIQNNSLIANISYEFNDLVSFARFNAKFSFEINSSYLLVFLSKRIPYSKPYCISQLSMINLYLINKENENYQGSLIQSHIFTDTNFKVIQQDSGFVQIEVVYSIYNNFNNSIENIILNLKSNHNCSDNIKIISIDLHGFNGNVILKDQKINITIVYELNLTLSYFILPITYHSDTPWFHSIQVSDALLLGHRSITITKKIDKQIFMQNENIVVKIQVRNDGNLSLVNLIIRDEDNYPIEGFSLVSGTLITKIDHLKPGEEKEITYTLSANSIGRYIMKPVSVQLDYGLIATLTSNTLPLTVIPSLVFWLSSIIGLIGLSSLIYIIIKNKPKLLGLITNMDGD